MMDRVYVAGFAFLVLACVAAWVALEWRIGVWRRPILRALRQSPCGLTRCGIEADTRCTRWIAGWLLGLALADLVRCGKVTRSLIPIGERACIVKYRLPSGAHRVRHRPAQGAVNWVVMYVLLLVGGAAVALPVLYHFRDRAGEPAALAVRPCQPAGAPCHDNSECCGSLWCGPHNTCVSTSWAGL